MFSQMKVFPIFLEMEPCTFQFKIKKFLILQETKALKMFFIFFSKKAILIFEETETLKKLLVLQETKFFYISGSNFVHKKWKNPLKVLTFREIKLLNDKLKRLFIFEDGTEKAPKTNKKSAPKKTLVSFDVFVTFTALNYKEVPFENLRSTVKPRKISCDYLYTPAKHKEISYDYLNVM